MKNRSPNKQSAVEVNAEPATNAAASDNTAADAAAVISSQERQRMIAEAAYLRAEQRGFAAGWEQEDWLLAEAEIDRLIQASTLQPSPLLGSK
ncbi:MAG: DUF2934 domain-containing protein [Betaproteobacteria bacterium]